MIHMQKSEGSFDWENLTALPKRQYFSRQGENKKDYPNLNYNSGKIRQLRLIKINKITVYIF